MAKRRKVYKTIFTPTNGLGSKPEDVAQDGIVAYQLQYHGKTLIDVRHMVEMIVREYRGTEGVHESTKLVPCDELGQPKPWGSGEQSGDFRIDSLAMSIAQGEVMRMGSAAHPTDQDEDPETVFFDRVRTRVETDENFRSRLRGIL